MSLPASGLISLADVNVELGRASTTYATLDESAVRTLAGVASGVIYLSNLHGKSSYTPMNISKYDVYDLDYATGTAYLGHWYPEVIVTSGGSGGFTYAWSFTSNSGGFSLAGSTTAIGHVTHNVTKFGYTGGCILQCVVSDNTGHSVTVSNIAVNVEINDPANP